jgi:hypothetical protein
VRTGRFSGDAVNGPEMPSGLAEAGARLWSGTFAVQPDGSRLELRADELVLLAEACRLVDDVEAIRGELADQDLTAAGSMGQPVAHPLRSELHRTVGTLDRLLRTLALPDDPAVSASWAGRNLARQRWGA